MSEGNRAALDRFAASQRLDARTSENTFRFTTAKRITLIPPKEALVYDTDLDQWYVGDGITYGGVPQLENEESVWTLFDDFNYQAGFTEADKPFVLNSGSDDLAVDPAINAQENGVLRITAGDGDGSMAVDGSQIVCAVPVQADSGGLEVEARLHINSSIANVAVGFGLTDSTSLEEPASVASETITTTASDAACLVYDASTFDSVALTGGESDDDTFTAGAAHGLVTGQPCQILLDGGDAGGITDDAVYYAIVLTTTTFKVATTYANALAGTAQAISSDTGAGDVVPLPNWYLIAVDGDTDDTGNGSISATNYANAPVADTYQTLRLAVSSDGATIRAYVDGALVKTLSGAAGISPDVNTYLTVWANGDSVNGAAKTVDVDYVKIVKNR